MDRWIGAPGGEVWFREDGEPLPLKLFFSENGAIRFTRAARSVVDSELAPLRCGCSLVTQSRAEYQTSPGGVEGRERLPPLDYPE